VRSTLADLSASSDLAEASAAQASEFKRTVRVMFRRKVVAGGVVVIALLMATALLGPMIAPVDPYEQGLSSRLAPPSGVNLLGTDELGRDVLSRLIYGARISLLVGIVAITIAGTVGMALGLVAGYFGGWTNIIIMRFTDALLALPPLVLMLAIAAILGGGLFNVLVAIGISMMPTYCRLMCGQIATLKQNEYVTALRSMGALHNRIMFRHLLPNAFPPLLVLLSVNLGTAIMMEASLSFLGIGITPPTATWGGMVSSGYRFLMSNPLMSFAPGCAILLVVLAFNMAGDGLRDALDPRLRGIV
jgi:peptide/nickel transport system permease protein